MLSDEWDDERTGCSDSDDFENGDGECKSELDDERIGESDTAEGSASFENERSGSSDSDSEVASVNQALLDRIKIFMIGAGLNNKSRKGEKYIDWALSFNKDRMDNAIRTCLNNSRLPHFERESIRKISRRFKVPRSTLTSRLRQEDPFAVPVLGRKGLFDLSDRNAIVDTVLALDNLNNGKNDKEVVSALADLHPEYSSAQIRDAWRKTIKPSSDRLRSYKVQASDKDRSGAITEVAQRFYFNLVDTAREMAEIRSAPDGEDKDGPTRKEWRRLEAHFTLCLDEAGHCASLGSERVNGDSKKSKHEKNSADSRISITGVECGSAAGDDGPTIYLAEGKELPKYFEKQFGNSKWLESKGAPPNSFVTMTGGAYMTHEAWDLSAPKLAQGIRNMPVIRDHPEFWVILHLDGFKSHVMTYEAQQILYDHKILVVKENSQSSHVNQAYDQEPAKKGKAEDRRWLPAIRDRPGLLRSMDQWTLICGVMTGQNGGRGAAWTAGFKRVNLHPDHRLPIDVWLSKISQYLVAAGGCDAATKEVYGLDYVRQIKVPEFFETMPVEDKRELLQLTGDEAKFAWDFEAIDTLPTKYKTHLRNGKLLYQFFTFVNHRANCMERELMTPDELTFLPAISRLRSKIIEQTPKLPQTEINKKAMVANGLHSYAMLGAPGLSTKEKWEAVLRYRARFAGNTPSSYLALEVTTLQSQTLLKMSAKELSIGSFLSSGLDINIGKKLAARKLNMLGEIEGLSCVANGEERLKRLKQAANLGSAIEEMKIAKLNYKKEKAAAKKAQQMEKAALALSEKPITDLLQADGLWPPPGGVAGSRVTVKPMLEFLTKHNIRAPKPKRKENLITFFTKLCFLKTTDPNLSMPELGVSTARALGVSQPLFAGRGRGARGRSAQGALWELMLPNWA